MIQVAMPPPCLVLPGADPSPPGKPHKLTHVDNPLAEVGIKPQLSSRGRVTKKEDQKTFHQPYKLQIKST